eukprot:TRINITY_DN6751_c0_g1::TRINITY_DN6751_c0_g1_i1::g.3057::m.3057 TRINITY_DN6751_c0_g1::TRINITY_DN6751_c0_g1_i1::g.3057  ORF type:complete len:380 (-),score=98.22,sp/Q9C9U5/SIS8_ARATH/41.18/2e-70,Pkinase_Tyr/PF07714.12/8.2e-66,Pkinase/PF00069.20/2.5e-60,APH/PF01636.18/3.4e+03,APH/PF01636.18/0.0021 TRINITY_DN6751_c0_g1_i1:100-1155(-)
MAVLRHQMSDEGSDPELHDLVGKDEHRGMQGGVVEFEDKQALIRIGNGMVFKLPTSASSHLILFNELKMEQRIGIGGFGEVFKGVWRGTDVAIKKLLDQQATEDLLREFVSEISTLASVQHPNIVLLMGWCASPLCIVTEYCAGGSLWRILRKRESLAPLALKRVLAFSLDIARGVNFLHSASPPIIHRDLKSPNVLVDSNHRLKISDFGLCKLRTRTMVSRGTAMMGTPEWMAPEVAQAEPYTERVDVFAFGVILWELLTGEIPWKEFHPMQIVTCVCAGKRLSIPESAMKRCNGLDVLISQCWDQDADKRPGFPDILHTLANMSLRAIAEDKSRSATTQSTTNLPDDTA